MNFFADMCMPVRAVDWLKDQGFQATHARDVGMHTADDRAILAKANEDNATLLTMDLDFGYLMSISGAKFPSVVIFRLSDQRADRVIQRLSAVIECCADDLTEGVLIIAEEDSIRIRQLPI